MKPVEYAALEVCAEVERAQAKFPPFKSHHEAYAVLLEEVEEFWDAIKANDYKNSRAEAVQVAAMALRYLAEFEAIKP